MKELENWSNRGLLIKKASENILKEYSFDFISNLSEKLQIHLNENLQFKTIVECDDLDKAKGIIKFKTEQGEEKEIFFSIERND